MLYKVKNFIKIRKKIIFPIVTIGLILFTLPFVIYFIFSRSYQPSIYRSVKDVPETYAALVLGAGLEPDGSPSPMLHDRVVTAVDLYKAGKVKKLIMSGDNRYVYHNEPESMIELAKKLGVSEVDLQADYAGRRTYDSCYRAKNIFSQDKIIVITQSYHIVRSMYLCKGMGIDTIGYAADTPQYTAVEWNYYKFRDVFALIQSFIDVFVNKPVVVGGDKIDI